MHLFDAFDSIAGYGPAAEFLSVSEKEVQNNFAKYGLGSGVHYYKGLFNEKMPVFYEKHERRRPALHIAVLRIDGNYFESYHDALYYMWEFVTVGGFIIFDDIKAADRTALGKVWLSFRKEHDLQESLIAIDDLSSFFWKVSDIKVKWDSHQRIKDQMAEMRIKRVSCPMNEA